MSTASLFASSLSIDETVDVPLTEGEIVARVIATVVLTLLAGLFSGLTLGLMSLEELELDLLIASGSAQQAKYAKRIKPVRAAGNRLLTTLVLTNTAVYTLMPIIVADLTNGVAGFIISTILSVLFGEILPQAVCSRHGLSIGANTVWLVRVLMIILFPLAWPIGKGLDLLLGKEIATSYSRKELAQLVSFHAAGARPQVEGEKGGGDLTADEAKIIRQALAFSVTTVEQVMTPLKLTFMLSIDSVLDINTMRAVVRAGHSRIPVHDGTSRQNVIGLLFVKRLVLLSPDMCVPVRQILEVTHQRAPAVRHDLTLDEMLNSFQWGRSHLAVVRVPKSLLPPSGVDEGKESVPIAEKEKNASAKSKNNSKKSAKAAAIGVKSDATGTIEVKPVSGLAVNASPSTKKESKRGKKKGSKGSVKANNDIVKEPTTSSSTTTGAAAVEEKSRAEQVQEHEHTQKELWSDDYATIGIVTLEDVIEELIGEDIADEFDFDEHREAAAEATARSLASSGSADLAVSDGAELLDDVKHHRQRMEDLIMMAYAASKFKRALDEPQAEKLSMLRKSSELAAAAAAAKSSKSRASGGRSRRRGARGGAHRSARRKKPPTAASTAPAASAPPTTLASPSRARLRWLAAADRVRQLSSSSLAQITGQQTPATQRRVSKAASLGESGGGSGAFKSTSVAVEALENKEAAE